MKLKVLGIRIVFGWLGMFGSLWEFWRMLGGREGEEKEKKGGRRRQRSSGTGEIGGRVLERKRRRNRRWWGCVVCGFCFWEGEEAAGYEGFTAVTGNISRL